MSELLGALPAIVVTLNHLHRKFMFAVVNPNDSIQVHHLSGQFYELEELAIISRHWRADGAFVDIGANVGNHSIFVSKLLDSPKTIVFEPNPPAISVLRLNLLLNQCERVDTRFLGVALGAAPGFARMVPDPDTPNNLGGNSTNLDPQGDVVVAAGDSLLAQERVAFLKIDIEGMELDVLHGLDETIARWRPNIFIEVRDTNAEAFGAWVVQKGYRVAETFARYSTMKNYMLVFNG